MTAISRLIRLALQGGILLGAACSFSVDFDVLEDGSCPSGTKACNARCVGLDDPDTGCGQPGCFPCNLPHALAICGPRGECLKSICIADWSDCDEDPSDCETDLAHDTNNCGRCKVQCANVPNGRPACAAKRCTVGSCNPGFEDCNRITSDGCEAVLDSDPANCGQCGKICESGQCAAGTCS